MKRGDGIDVSCPAYFSRLGGPLDFHHVVMPLLEKAGLKSSTGPAIERDPAQADRPRWHQIDRVEAQADEVLAPLS